jgi:transposase
MQSGVPTKHNAKVPEGDMIDKRIFGIDVAKGWLDAGLAGEARIERIDNTAEAIDAWLDQARPTMVAFEPTGGYERTLREALRRRGVLFVRVHPNELIAFRKARGIKAKTDPIDARLIAAFAAEELPRRGIKPSIAGDETLRELAARRRQLVETLHAERCRLDLAQAPAVRASLAVVIEAMAASLETLEAELARRIAADPDLAQLASLLRSLKCVGPVTVLTLIAELPELGYLSGKEIASLVGLAPRTRRSGKAVGREITGHGRPGVRRVLFNAARSAIRHNPAMAAFYRRLTQDNGRPGRVALTAVMRKMLVTLNAIARDKQPWHGIACQA